MAKCVKFISENLDSWIKESGKTQSEIARELGINPTYINQLIKGTNSNPSLQYLEAIAGYFHRTVSDIVRDPKDPGGHKPQDCFRVFKTASNALLDRNFEHPLVKALLDEK